MSEREKFIETIRKSMCGVVMSYTAKVLAEKAADALISEGAMFPPCKVGDTVYFIVEDEMEEDKKYITSQRINDVSTRGIYLSTSIVEENCNDFEPYSEFGKTVFLTKEEAEQALKGR